MPPVISSAASVVPLALVAAALACSAPAPAPERPRVPGDDHGVLALVVEGDTTVLDEYSRTEGVLGGLVQPRTAGAKMGWARYRVTFGPGGGPTGATLWLGRVGTRPDEAPAATWTVEIRDTLLIERGPQGPPVTRRVRGGAVPVFAPSIAMTHEIVREAIRRAGRGSPSEVTVLPMATRGEPYVARVEWATRDTAVVSHRGSAGMRFAVDSAGRLSAGQSPGRAHSVVRVR